MKLLKTSAYIIAGIFIGQYSIADTCELDSRVKYEEGLFTSGYVAFEITDFDGSVKFERSFNSGNERLFVGLTEPKLNGAQTGIIAARISTGKKLPDSSSVGVGANYYMDNNSFIKTVSRSGDVVEHIVEIKDSVKIEGVETDILKKTIVKFDTVKKEIIAVRVQYPVMYIVQSGPPANVVWYTGEQNEVCVKDVKYIGWTHGLFNLVN